MCGGKEIKARVHPPEASTVIAFGQSSDPPPYRQQKTGLFRNTMIAPATQKLCHRVTKGPSPCQGSPTTAYNSRSRSLCGGKEIKARVHPPDASIVKAFSQSSVPSPNHQQKTGLFRNTMIAPATQKLCHRVTKGPSPCQGSQGDKRTVPLSGFNAKALPQGDKRTVPLSGTAPTPRICTGSPHASRLHFFQLSSFRFPLAN